MQGWQRSARKVDPRGLGFLLIAVTAIACGRSPSPAPAKGTKSGKSDDAEAPPNIVVVLVDDLRWDEYAAAGHNYIETPSIDRIAAEGTRFTQAFTSTPLCSPSRASFLTGQYAHNNGITDNLARNAQSHKLQTFPAALDKAGYDTAFIGKWHMGNDDTPRPGFDHWVALKGQGEIHDPKLNIDGERKTVEGYTTDVLTDFALKFIHKSRKEPFLLYLSHKALHPNLLQRDDGSVARIGSGGFVPAKRHAGRYATAVFNRRKNNGVPPTDKPALMRTIGDLPALGPETVTKEKTIRERAEMLLAVDEGLGKLLDALKATGQLDRTVVVFASDHGYWYGEHGLSVERRLAYEESIRIPMLIRYPKLAKAGAKVDAMVANLDLAPTLIELGRAKPATKLDGQSLVPLLRGEAHEWRKSILIEYYSDTVFERIDHMGYRAIRDGRYKYIQYQDLEGMDELYDLERDPFELNNLAADKGSAERLKKMQAELLRLRKAAGDPGV